MALTGCSFIDVNTFVFQSNTTATGTTFRRCGLVTPASATLTSCTFDRPSGTTGITITGAELANISGCDFVSDGTGYGITITGSAGTWAMSGLTFTGYAATNGATGNEAIFVNISSGTVTLNITNGGSTPSIRTAGATVVVNNSKVLTLEGLVPGSDIVINSSDTNNNLVNVDSNVGTSYQYTYPASYIGSLVDIKIMLAGYSPYAVYDYTLGAADSSLPVAQVVDRAFI